MSHETHRVIDKELVRPTHTGLDLLHDPGLNKGTGFTEEERRRLGLEGLLPPRVAGIAEQTERVLENYRKKPNDLEKYIYLAGLQDRNETLYYHIILQNILELMPVIYTPTVGKACQEYGHIFRRPRGIFLAREHQGSMPHVLRNWPEPDIRVIVVTDGERILGLGDLGANGMGIPVGKLALYTACAGVHPSQTLPVTLDVGTNNEELLRDPLYLGTQEHRLTGDEYDAFVEEFVTAVREVFPRSLIQFEDFANRNAFRLLERYRDQVCCFNDDIQGTASVTLAGIFSASRLTRRTLADQKILFHGAGEAAIGIGNLVVSALIDGGLTRDEAMRRCWFCDSRGLVQSGRDDLQPHKRPYAHDHRPLRGLVDIVRDLRPTMICGVSGQPRQFTREVVEEMSRINERPIVFALSNPTSKAECTAEQAYGWSGGRAIFASGSPFAPVTLEGRTYVPGQGNNAYVFPGVGLGALVCGTRRITDEMFFEAAKTLAALVSDEDLAQGCVYPPLTRIREVSARIAAAVCGVAYRRSLATVAPPVDLLERIREAQYQPEYRRYV